MEKTYYMVVRTVRRLPYGDQAITATRQHLPAPIKRLLRRTRHRMLMRSPSSFLSRLITPGVQNRLLADPAVVQRLLDTDRANEIISHRPPTAGNSIDWVAQVSLNDPARVVGTLESLAVTSPQVDAAIDRLVAGRPPVLSEEQVVDVFLSLDEFEKRRYFANQRVQAAFLDYLFHDRDVAETRTQLMEKFDLIDASAPSKKKV